MLEISVNPMPSLLNVRGLRTTFKLPEADVRAVDTISMEIRRGELVGLVGESGSGKTVTALSILGLIQSPGELEAEAITFDGIDLLCLTDNAWSEIRGARIALIFQDPKVRLNPVFSIGSQIAESIQIHKGFNRQDAWARMLAALREVDIPDAALRAHAYPHELSMGQAQRVMIAMALAMEPDLIIADEPTSSLDTSIQAQVLALLEAQRTQRGTAILLISHNLAVMAQVAQRVIVLYAGHIVEQAPVERLFNSPYHPYTQGLLASIPYNQPAENRLHSIPGRMPDAHELPSGCRFSPRCEVREAFGLNICDQEAPTLIAMAAGHHVRCWLYQSQDEHQAPLKKPLEDQHSMRGGMSSPS